MTDLAGQDRLIVALDVPTHDEALRLVDELENVSFFKIGLTLFLAGDLLGLLKRLRQRRGATGGVFIDLKLAGDIGNTVADFVAGASELGIRFITLVPTDPLAITQHSIQTVQSARGDASYPQVLMVPFLSSMGVEELHAAGIKGTVDDYIVQRGHALRDIGTDGLIVSGTAIGACRTVFTDLTIVSPGIRPAWSTADDHARLTTPAVAIHLGADYLVVGRPVRTATKRRDAAQRIIDEIDEALAAPRPNGQTHRPAFAHRG